MTFDGLKIPDAVHLWFLIGMEIVPMDVQYDNSNHCAIAIWFAKRIAVYFRCMLGILLGQTGSLE